MTLRLPAGVQRVLLLIAEHAALALLAGSQHGGDQPTATFRDDGIVRVPEQWATLRPRTTAGEPA